jgi:hypothetical protein
MLGDKDGYLALGLALGFMGALALFIWGDGFASLGYCNGACLREWVGATSGWAAAFAAGATILYLNRENRKRDILEWREIVNSAELLCGILCPQVEHLGAALRMIDDPKTPEWLGPCLDRIQAALLDPQNQNFRRASVITAARVRGCLSLIEHCRILVNTALATKAAIQPPGLVVGLNQELQELMTELNRIRDSALDPKMYRGI